ncbi:glycyl-radical enzyme activating protein [uncultured Pseudoramibacter sp.]|uniref:glycyl-radical enzyme activating protein n=1 Tax=uncultured Pseudoramibacter sp. TaxID=1623493 RepID=UPI0025D27720|nr:glycyl-radical enzyme activating protein [uncultured Pseudoramibacter sp.]
MGTDQAKIANIVRIQRFSLQDGPGIRTTVFFKGCPLRCWWCSNPESQKTTMEKMKIAQLAGGEKWEKVGTKMTVDEIVREAMKDAVFYRNGGGVTFSGGEPLMYAEIIAEAAAQLKTQGVHLILDTSGYASETVVNQVVPLFDEVYFDVKHMDSETHKKITGVDNFQILSNLRLISSMNVPVAIRYPMIPGINNSVENMDAMARMIKDLPQYTALYILPYHRYGMSKYRQLDREYRLSNVKVPSSERVAEVAMFFSDRGIRVKTYGKKST